jgi:DMSO/TMAO reductase YedYZ molybdopterin-dependent catalytic subunit
MRLFAAAMMLATVAFLPCAHAQPTAAPALTVKGSVERELAFTIEELKRFPVQRIEDVRIVRETGSSAGTPEIARRYTGCLLRDVLDRAKLVEKNRFDLRKSVVIVTASDGYRAIFSWAELYLSPIGEGAMIVYERDSAPLADNEGPLALVSLKDLRPGPRHVKWLKSIELRVLAD